MVRRLLSLSTAPGTDAADALARHAVTHAHAGASFAGHAGQRHGLNRRQHRAVPQRRALFERQPHRRRATVNLAPSLPVTTRWIESTRPPGLPGAAAGGSGLGCYCSRRSSASTSTFARWSNGTRPTALSCWRPTCSGARRRASSWATWATTAPVAWHWRRSLRLPQLLADLRHRAGGCCATGPRWGGRVGTLGYCMGGRPGLAGGGGHQRRLRGGFYGGGIHTMLDRAAAVLPAAVPLRRARRPHSAGGIGNRCRRGGGKGRRAAPSTPAPPRFQLLGAGQLSRRQCRACRTAVSTNLPGPASCSDGRPRYSSSASRSRISTAEEAERGQHRPLHDQQAALAPRP